MASTIRDVMTPNPICLAPGATAADAARAMRDADVGDVIVSDGDTIKGILTDRDIVVRAVAEGRNPADVRVGEICSPDVQTLTPDATADDALRLMREHAVRRVPVVDGGRPVGVVTLGDLADDKNVDTTVEKISAAPPNN
jgi:CBS domain-containing protein